ncbi:hypothetical protein FWH13_03550 [Candidatus Saccharibacteria bacterium]|nr:hypothetical protein [Candidatus Saccharibacteria bacterium]
MNPKKAYVDGYVDKIDECLKALYDEGNKDAIIARDQAAMGDDFQEFENTITAVYEQIETARNNLAAYADKFQ